MADLGRSRHHISDQYERPLSMLAMIESEPVYQIRFRLFYTYYNPY
jgi:hypothetical protein